MATAPSKLSDAEIAQRLSALKGWPRSERGWQRESNAIMKEFVLGGFTHNDFDLAAKIDQLGT